MEVTQNCILQYLLQSWESNPYFMPSVTALHILCVIVTADYDCEVAISAGQKTEFWKTQDFLQWRLHTELKFSIENWNHVYIRLWLVPEKKHSIHMAFRQMWGPLNHCIRVYTFCTYSSRESNGYVATLARINNFYFKIMNGCIQGWPCLRQTYIYNTLSSPCIFQHLQQNEKSNYPQLRSSTQVHWGHAVA